jgi:hypothetical protein
VPVEEPDTMNQYDYTNQAWLVNGRYVACNHPEAMQCLCYGKLNAGKPAAKDADIHPTEDEMERARR